jgi:hypothetical protein
MSDDRESQPLQFAQCFDWFYVLGLKTPYSVLRTPYYVLCTVYCLLFTVYCLLFTHFPLR